MFYNDWNWKVPRNLLRLSLLRSDTGLKDSDVGDLEFCYLSLASAERAFNWTSQTLGKFRPT